MGFEPTTSCLGSRTPRFSLLASRLRGPQACPVYQAIGRQAPFLHHFCHELSCPFEYSLHTVKVSSILPQITWPGAVFSVFDKGITAIFPKGRSQLFFGVHHNGTVPDPIDTGREMSATSDTLIKRLTPLSRLPSLR